MTQASLFLAPFILLAAASDLAADSINGRAGTMPALYDSQVFTVNFKAQPDQSAAALIAHNASINFIYFAEVPLPNGQMFLPVLDAIQGDGFNPLWVEVDIAFTAGHTPRQLGSDDQIADALADGEITIETTGEVYRCAVIGPKQ